MREIKEIILTFLKKATSTRFVLSLLSIKLSALLLIRGFITAEVFAKIITTIVIVYVSGRSATHFAKKFFNAGNGEGKQD